MAYDLFHIANGRKASVLRFETYDDAKAHAVSMFGQFIAEESDVESMYHAVDVFTDRGEVLAIESTDRWVYAS